MPIASLIFQLLLIYHTPRATVTLLPKEQTIRIKTTEQIKARELPTLSLSQSKTAQTTGRGHQDAMKAAGAITFYNGAFTSQFVPTGTILTGSDGEPVQTLQPAYLPPANPNLPSFAVAILAQSTQYGSQGNIAPYDINTTFTATIFAKNTTRFTGGQNERNFPTVSNTAIARLTKQDLQIRAANLLTSRLRSQFGVGYNLLQPVTATITNVAWQKNIVTFSLSCQATGIYQFSRLQQTQIKQEFAGKSTDEALRLLLHKEGVQTAFIDGVDKAVTLPGNSNSITITVSKQ